MIHHRFNTHEAPTRSKPLGSVPHLAYLSSLSLGGRAYSGLSWRIFSLSRFHPSGVPTIGHSRESNIIILCGTEYWVLAHSSTFISPCQCSVFSVHFRYYSVFSILVSHCLSISVHVALYALPALAPHCTHHDRPCKQASGYFLSSLPPPGRGAASSSSPPSPVISPVFALRSDYQAFAVICMAVVWEITANRARNPSSQILDLPKY